MKKYLACILFVFFTGCVGALTLKDTKTVEGDYQTIAKNIYQAATKCWAREAITMRAGIAVESTVGIGSIKISCRFIFKATGEAYEPFMAFVVIPDAANNTKINLFVQEPGPVGQEKRLKEAYNWIAGNYICVPEE